MKTTYLFLYSDKNNISPIGHVFIRAVSARIAAFEGRASAYIWDGLRLARNKNSRDMALYYTVSTVIQTLNAWLQVSCGPGNRATYRSLSIRALFSGYA